MSIMIDDIIGIMSIANHPNTIILNYIQYRIKDSYPKHSQVDYTPNRVLYASPTIPSNVHGDHCEFDLAIFLVCLRSASIFAFPLLDLTTVCPSSIPPSSTQNL
jgi:hypothetical protein